MEYSNLPICHTCGVQYGESLTISPICADERQYVGWGGQEWTTLAELRAAGYHGRIAEEGPGVIGVGIEAAFAVGQRALVVRASSGNVLWDCIPYLDDEIVAELDAIGGISAIALSHPHFYGSMIEWSRALEAPIYIHAADRQWLPRPDASVILWEGDTHDLAPGMTLINAGLHFDGGTVLHWRDSDDGKGALMTGDIIQVSMDRRWASFMYSFPNHIPERPGRLRRAVEMLDAYHFDRVYAAFWGRVIKTDAQGALRRSVERYLKFALDDR